MKQCKGCLKVRDFIAFYKRSDYSDGYSSLCRMCKQTGYNTLKPDPTLKEKYCASCQSTKEISEFGKNRSNKSGYATYCKLCAKQRTRARYENDPLYNYKRRLASRLWKEDNPERHSAAVRRARAKYAAQRREASAESRTLTDKAPTG